MKQYKVVYDVGRPATEEIINRWATMNWALDQMIPIAETFTLVFTLETDGLMMMMAQQALEKTGEEPNIYPDMEKKCNELSSPMQDQTEREPKRSRSKGHANGGGPISPAKQGRGKTSKRRATS